MEPACINAPANDGRGEWQAVSDETAPSGSPPCITVTINETTEPTLKQLTGTEFAVAVLTKPEVTRQPTNKTVTAGEPASFTAAASGGPTPSVQWQVSTNGGSSWTKDTTDGGNATTTLTIGATTASQNNNEYRAVFSNVVASGVASAAATLMVQSAPVVTTNPTSQTVEAGAPASFTTEASGNPTPTVQWQLSTNGGSSWTKDTTDGGNATTTLTIADTTASQSNNEYRAVFNNVVASGVASSAATLTVQSATQLSTSLSGAGQSGATITVPQGTAVTDHATLSGENAAKATGTVEYKVYSDNECRNLVASAGTVKVASGVIPASNATGLARTMTGRPPTAATKPTRDRAAHAAQRR